MNDLSNAALREYKNHQNCLINPSVIPTPAIYILVGVFLFGFSVSVFILVAVHNPSLVVFLVFLVFLVLGFLAWSSLHLRRKSAVFHFLGSFPDSDLNVASDGQIVKLTGHASCGSVSLESSYERAARCIYTSTLLYEKNVGNKLKPKVTNARCTCWSLTYCERFSTDFYLTDAKSGIRAMVKAGSGCKLVSLIGESKLVTTRQGRALSPHLRKWLQDRNLSDEARLIRLEEGHIQEGAFVTVMGMLHKNDDVLMIVEPQELLSTGCIWRKLLLPMDVDGLILAVPNINNSIRNSLQAALG